MNAQQIVEYLNETRGDNEPRLDVGETAVLARKLEHVKSSTYDVQYSGFMARNFIPVATDTPAGAETITYYQWDQYGMAKVIANFADDLPMVDAFAKTFTSNVKSLGAAFKYSTQDLRRAAMSGNQLDTRRAKAARRAIDAAIDEIAAVGVSGGGVTGITNNANVGITASAGTWASATALVILGELNGLLSTIKSNTKGLYSATQILIPQTQYNRANTLTFSADNSKTVLQVFKENNPGVAVDVWQRLNLADAEGDGPRIIAYARDPEVLQLEIPLDFNQLPPEKRNLAYVVDCEARCGGVIVTYPLAMQYLDGTAG